MRMRRNQEYTARDAIEAAIFRGELDADMEGDFSVRVEAERRGRGTRSGSGRIAAISSRCGSVPLRARPDHGGGDGSVAGKSGPQRLMISATTLRRRLLRQRRFMKTLLRMT